MDEFQLGVLGALIKSYNGSVMSKGGSLRNLKIRLGLKDKALATYNGRDAFKYIDSNDEKLSELQKLGYIIVHRNNAGALEWVELNISAVDDIIKACGFDNKNAHLKNIITLLSAGGNIGFVELFAQSEREYASTKYDWHKSYYKDEDELAVVLKALNAMASQTDEIMERDFSVKVLGDSKAFSRISKKLIQIAKKFDDQLVVEDEDDDKIVLLNYNIVKNSTYALIKGKLNFKLNDQSIELEKLKFEYALNDAMIKNIEFMPSEFSKLITVENLTSFYKLEEEDSLIVYLAGFHNHTKQLLLEKLYKAFSPKVCLHFGDIDVGGFMIFNNLVQSTGISFLPYHMGIEELERYNDKAKPLTANDVSRLQKLRSDPEFSIFEEVIDYMLAHNLKLEQEALD